MGLRYFEPTQVSQVDANGVPKQRLLAGDSFLVTDGDGNLKVVTPGNNRLLYSGSLGQLSALALGFDGFLAITSAGQPQAISLLDDTFAGHRAGGNVGALTSTQARTILGLANQTVLMPPLYVGSTGLATNYLAGRTHFAYVGRAAEAITTADIVANAAIAWVAGTWAEVGIFTGDFVANGNATLTRRGFADVSATYNSTGTKVTTVSLSGVSVGDDLWMAFSSDAGTVFQVRATLQDTIQSGILQFRAERLSLISAATAMTIEGGGARGPWARVIL